MIRLHLTRGFGMAIGMLFAACLHAQESRDPTVPPPDTSTSPTRSNAGVEGMTVMVRDGKPYLVVGTRWYATGDKVGAMRVERITETEIWLHDGTALLKIPRFAGIERTASKTEAKPVCGAAQSAAPEGSASAPAAAGTGKKSKKKAKTPQKGSSSPLDAASNSPSAVAPCEDTPS
jgi:hypothetical protein